MAATAGYIAGAGTQPQGYQVTPQPAQNVSLPTPQFDQVSNPAQSGQVIYTSTAPDTTPAATTAPAATPAATTAQPNIFEQSAQGMNIAGEAAALGTQYQPMNVEAQTVAGMDLSQYTNPYETAVVQQSLDDLERARQIEQNLSDYQMGQAGAFGGSRHGIAQAEAARNYYDRAGALASNLRQQGFTQAQNLAGQDAQRMMQASLANQSAGLGAAGQRLAAAGQLSNISNLGFDMGRQLTADIMKQGTLQQMLEQNLIDAAKGQFSGYTGAPADTISYLSQALGASNVPQSQQTSRDLGLFDYLTLAAVV